MLKPNVMLKICSVLTALFIFEVMGLSQHLTLAVTITVNSGEAIYSPDGKCSLPEAIQNANNASRIFTGAGECPAGAVGIDTINLTTDVNLSGILEQTDGNNGLPVIRNNLIINGNNHIVQRRAALDTIIAFRLLQIDTGITVEIYDLTLANGSAINTNSSNGGRGGGILNFGTLILDNVTVTNSDSINEWWWNV